MSFIAYLLAGLSIAATPAIGGQAGSSTAASQSDKASSTTPQPDQSKPPPDTARSPSQKEEPYHHAKVKKHYSPSHKEATESQTMRKRDAVNGEGKTSAKKSSSTTTTETTDSSSKTQKQ